VSVKMEHISPIINMYLLGNPDHYCSHNFGSFYWQSFVAGNSEKCNTGKVTVLKQGNRVVGLSPVQDYIWHPQELESFSLYNWIGNCVQEKKRKKRKVSTSVSAAPTPN
ncbi:hypothetical protein L208DRAFT_1235272, partial [Tricholoma matsutake]